MDNSDENDEETDEHAMAETSEKSGTETPNQTMKTSDETDQETSSHVCKICDKLFCDSRNLKNHIRNIHEGIKDFACDVCAKKAC